jgi:hypothetical protein
VVLVPDEIRDAGEGGDVTARSEGDDAGEVGVFPRFHAWLPDD